MFHFARLEADQGIDDLHDDARAKGADDRSDPHRAAQQPAHQQHRRPQQDFHNADRNLRHPFAETDQQRVPGAAALFAFHIDRHTERHEDEAGQHDQDAGPQVRVQRKRIETVEQLHEIAGQQRVDNRSEADALFQQQVDPQDDNRHEGHGKAVVQRRMIGDTHAQAVPGRQADIREDGQMDAESENKQPGDNFDPVCQYPALHFPIPRKRDPSAGVPAGGLPHHSTYFQQGCQSDRPERRRRILSQFCTDNSFKSKCFRL